MAKNTEPETKARQWEILEDPLSTQHFSISVRSEDR